MKDLLHLYNHQERHNCLKICVVVFSGANHELNHSNLVEDNSSDIEIIYGMEEIAYSQSFDDENFGLRTI